MKNPHQNPLIYLKGIDFQNCQAILQFIYQGQVEIAHDALKPFIDTATELEINGLTCLEFENVDQTKSDKAMIQSTEVKYEKEKERREYRNSMKLVKGHSLIVNHL